MANRRLRVCASGASCGAKMARFVFSEFVEPELSAIWDFIAMDNLDAADRFLEAAYGTFQELAKMPGMGCPRTFPHERLRNLRSLRIKGFENYLIFYGPIHGGSKCFTLSTERATSNSFNNS